MADDNKKTADQIVDDLAAELDAKDEQAPRHKASSDADLGGLFGVSSKKKTKKIAAETDALFDEVAGEGDAEADEAPAVKPAAAKPSAAKAAAPTPEVAPKKKRSPNAAAGLFNPNDDIDAPVPSSPHLDEDDLDGFDGEKKGGKTGLIVVGVLVVVGALAAIVLTQTELGTKIGMVLTGDYREYKLAEVKRIEEEFRQRQLAGLERYGNLTVMGDPLYATIKLNGQEQFGPTSSGEYRALQLKPGVSNFQDLKIKQKLTVEISSPGFESKTVELTENMWRGDDEPGATKGYNLTANLLPLTPWHQQEFAARMSTDTDTEDFGTINLQTTPPGAKILFNGAPLIDKDGKELVTPVSFTTYGVKDEKTGKIEERQVKVDTPFDSGPTIELEAANMPKYGLQLNRQMWTCTKKSEDEIKKLPKEHSIQQECNYTYDLNFSFNDLKAYIDGQEAERARVAEANAKMREAQAEFQKALESGDTEKLQALVTQ